MKRLKKTLGHKIEKLFSTKTSRFAGFFSGIIIFPLALMVAFSMIGLPVKGFDWLQGNAKEVDEKPKTSINYVDYNRTPAADIMNATFKKLDKKWDGNGPMIKSAGLPHPLSCVTPVPPLSHSRAYKDGKTETQVTLAAYTAGVGAYVFKKMRNSVDKCKSSDTITYTYDDDLGVESATIEVLWSGNKFETTYVRYGDLIAFVATNKNGKSSKTAKTVADIIADLMDDSVCANEKSVAADYTRNAAFSGKKFTGLQKVKRLETKKVSAPKLTKNQIEYGVEKVKAPAKKIKVKKVSLPNDDYNYVLWPELPKKVSLPKMPKTPKEQKLKSITGIRVKDPQGPGCGWKFLTTVQPKYDNAAVMADNDKNVKLAQKKLYDDGKRWQKDISDYWTDYHTYLTQVNKYKEYSSEVHSVSVAWNKIHKDWKKYYTLYANWENYNGQRDAIISSKKSAKKTLATQKNECEKYESDSKAYMKTHAKWKKRFDEFQSNKDDLMEQYKTDLQAWKDAAPEDPEDEDTREPKPTKPTPPKEPKEPKKLNHPCPPEKPSILGQDTPKKKKAPSKPPDPRPKSER